MIIDNDGYYTEYGQIDGKLITSDKVFVTTKNVGKKNETTIEQQAINEAMSIIQHKINSENFKTDIKDVDNIDFNPPMLAKEYESYNPNMKFIQPKLDGIRCNIHNGKAISRKNKPFYSVDHILKELNIPESIHLDGELYNHELKHDFNKIVSLVKKENIRADHLEEIENLVEYHIYDMWDDSRPELLFSERMSIIKELFSGLNKVKIVPTYEINSEEELEEKRIEFVNMGYEGAILRLDKPYEHKRSKNLLKYKVFNEEEFEVLDICEGKIKGYAEYAIVQLPLCTCRATIAMSLDKCIEMLENKDQYIGQLATVKFFGYTNDNKLRFPVLKSIRNYE